MTEGVRPHHVALCALLRLYLDPAALVARLTPEMYQHVGTVLLGEIRQSTSVSLPSLPELLIDLEVVVVGNTCNDAPLNGLGSCAPPALEPHQTRSCGNPVWQAPPNGSLHRSP